MGANRIIANDAVRMVESFRRINSRDREDFRLRASSRRLRKCSGQVTDILKETSLIFQVHARLRSGDEPSFALYLATTIPAFGHPARVSDLFGQRLLYRYGSRGFHLKKDLRLSVLYEFFGTVMSARSIQPDDYRSLGIKLFFPERQPPDITPPDHFGKTLLNRFGISECSIDLRASDSDVREFFDAVAGWQYVDVDALPKKGIYPIFGAEADGWSR